MNEGQPKQKELSDLLATELLIKLWFCWHLFLTYATQVQQQHKTNKTAKDIVLTEQAQSATSARQALSHPRYLNV